MPKKVTKTKKSAKLTVNSYKDAVEAFLVRDGELAKISGEHKGDKEKFRELAMEAIKTGTTAAGVFFSGKNGRGVSVSIPKPKLGSVDDLPLDKLAQLAALTQGSITEQLERTVTLTGSAAEWMIQTLEAWKRSGVVLDGPFQDGVEIEEERNVEVDEYTKKAMFDAALGSREGLAAQAAEILGDSLEDCVMVPTPKVTTTKDPNTKK